MKPTLCYDFEPKMRCEEEQGIFSPCPKKEASDALKTAKMNSFISPSSEG